MHDDKALIIGLGRKPDAAEFRCRCKLAGALERMGTAEACEMQGLKPGDSS